MPLDITACVPPPQCWQPQMWFCISNIMGGCCIAAVSIHPTAKPGQAVGATPSRFGASAAAPAAAVATIEPAAKPKVVS